MADLDVRALLEGTTPGPWATCQWNTSCVMPLLWANDELPVQDRGDFMVIYSTQEPDARLIAAAPALAARVLDLEAENERLLAALTVVDVATVVVGPLPPGVVMSLHSITANALRVTDQEGGQ